MIEAQDEAGFGSCSNTKACEAQCPKDIRILNIAKTYREYYKAY
jgi:succinate dehydrogenase / fumarate reductase iron-sulfur subunit